MQPLVVVPSDRLLRAWGGTHADRSTTEAPSLGCSSDQLCEQILLEHWVCKFDNTAGTLTHGGRPLRQVVG